MSITWVGIGAWVSFSYLLIETADPLAADMPLVGKHAWRFVSQ